MRLRHEKRWLVWVVELSTSCYSTLQGSTGGKYLLSRVAVSSPLSHAREQGQPEGPSPLRLLPIWALPHAVTWL